MKHTTFIGVAVVVAVVAALLGARYLRTRQSRPQFQTTQEMMDFLAADAVDIADKNFHIRLDYSVASIEKVEEILGKLHEEYNQTKSERGIHGLAMAFGAYIGETIKRSEPGSRWEQDSAVAGEKAYPLHWLRGESYPCAWCYRRITNGPEDNVWHKYLLLKQRTESGVDIKAP